MRDKVYLIFAIIGIFLTALAAVNTCSRNKELKRNMSDLNAKYEILLNAPQDTIRDIKTDTIRDVKPVYIDRYISEVDSVIIHDTIHHTIFNVPREVLTYKGDDYKAVVSGVSPRLDSIEVYSKTINQVITKHIEHTKYKRFGIGVGVGASYDGRKVRPAVTIGVQYNLISF